MTTDINFVMHMHWSYERFAETCRVYTEEKTGRRLTNPSNRLDKFFLKSDCLPWYTIWHDYSELDWVNARIMELEDKSKTIANDSWDIDVELSDCYYYSMSRRLLRKCDAFLVTECPFELRGKEPDITAGICITRCEATSCNYKS